MPQENELLAQRRANMEALAQLGVDLYPHEFDRSDTNTQKDANDFIGAAEFSTRRRQSHAKDNPSAEY